jgi:putative DNA-invertase from lambdoid prophage Rac
MLPAVAYVSRGSGLAAGRVNGYARVSTACQAREGESLDVQRRQIDGYAHMQGLTLEKVFTERGVR